MTKEEEGLRDPACAIGACRVHLWGWPAARAGRHWDTSSGFPTQMTSKNPNCGKTGLGSWQSNKPPITDVVKQSGPLLTRGCCDGSSAKEACSDRENLSLRPPHCPGRGGVVCSQEPRPWRRGFKSLLSY